MPILQVDLTKPADIKAGIAILRQHLDGGPKPAQAQQPAAAQQWLAQAITQMKQRKLWGFLKRVAAVNVPHYSLPELAELIGMPPRKVGSLKAILAKPEQRLGVQFLEPMPTGNVDAVGNPRYRMPENVKKAIQAA